MPTYEYYCAACDRDLEIFQSMKDDPLQMCPECEKPEKITRRISGGAGIIFKGSGFYETDYKRSKPKPEADKASSGDSSKAASDGGTTKSVEKAKSAKASD